MTPKEKAKELRDKYLPIVDYGQTEANNYAKKGALIAVDEILKKHYDDWDNNSIYWQQVKTEIEKI
jgi:hypothetical protein